jgi:hypothetical protein
VSEQVGREKRMRARGCGEGIAKSMGRDVGMPAFFQSQGYYRNDVAQHGYSRPKVTLSTCLIQLKITWSEHSHM